MTKQLTSAEAAAYLWGHPGKKLKDVSGDEVWVGISGTLWRTGADSGHALVDGRALESCNAPFTLPADPDELPEGVSRCLQKDGAFHGALTALWKHIKPEAKR